MSAPLPWAMVPTNFWALPVVQMAGHDAAVIVLTLLIDAGQWGADESLPAECLGPRRLAVATGLSERDGRKAATEHVTAALADAFDAGLLVRDGERVWFGPGLWVKRDDVRRKLSSDNRNRRRRHEDNAGTLSGHVRDSAGSLSGQCPDNVRQREEKRRVEESKQRASAREAAEPSALPDPGEQGEVIAAALAQLDTDAHRGKPEAWQKLVAAMDARGAHMGHRAATEVSTMLASHPTAVVAHVAAMVARGSEVIRSPAALVRSLLPAAVEAADSERREREAQARRDESTQKWLARREQAALRMQDPEAQAKAAALWGEIGAVLDGKGGG